MGLFQDIQNLFGGGSTWRQRLGGLVGLQGTSLRLPELGISEAIASEPQQQTTTTSWPQSTQPGYTPIPTGGDTLGTTTTTTPTGTTGPAPTGDGGGETAGPSFEELLNQAFQPGYDYLSSLESQLRAERPLAEEQLSTSFEEALIPIEEREQENIEAIRQQGVDVESGRKSAISQARRLFNELQQQGMSRFGGGTSTGPAFSEIVGRATAQQMGGAENIATEARVKLANEQARLGDFVNRQKTVLADKKRQSLEQIRLDFDRRIGEINASRGELETAKAQQRMDELIRARERAFALEDAEAAFQRQLDLFATEKTNQLSQQFNVGGISESAMDRFESLVKAGLSPTLAAQATGTSGVFGNLSGIMLPQDIIELEDGRLYDKRTGRIVDPSLFGGTSTLGTNIRTGG